MSRADFIARRKIYQRYWSFADALGGVAFATAIALSVWLERKGCDSGTCLLGVLLTAGLIGCIIFHTTMRGPQRRARQLGLICPSCSKLLVGSRAWQGIVTGHCASCGVKVLNLP